MPGKSLLPFTGVLVVMMFLMGQAVFSEVTHNGLDIERPSNVRPAPDFLLKNISGEDVTLKQYKGNIVLLNFWATWCRPCAKEMPSLNKLYNKFKDKGLVVLAISADRGNGNTVKVFAKENNLLFPVVLDRDGTARNEYEVYALPFTYLIDKKGKFIGRIIYEFNQSNLTRSHSITGRSKAYSHPQTSNAW